MCQGDANTSSSARYRRRIVVIGFLVLLTGGLLLTWYMSGLSQTERRFLGTWTISHLSGGRIITFHADGTWTRQQTPLLGRSITGFWHVDDSELVLVFHSTKWVQRDRPFRYALVQLFDRDLIDFLTDSPQIVSIDANVIRFRGSKQDFEFIRFEPERRETSNLVQPTAP